MFMMCDDELFPFGMTSDDHVIEIELSFLGENNLCLNVFMINVGFIFFTVIYIEIQFFMDFNSSDLILNMEI